MKTAVEIEARRREIAQRLEAVRLKQTEEAEKPIDSRDVYYLIFLQREVTAWNAALEQLDWVAARDGANVAVENDN